MATVHLAHVEMPDGERDPGRFVAVKCMHAHYARDPDFVSMFLDEAMLCTLIRHENVVETIDVSQEHEELLLVLELVEGESLSKLVKTIAARGQRVPKPIASAIVRDMLQGLHAAHEASNAAGEPLMIVHRDVSPHNVLVGTDGVARVLDFGVAKARGRVQQTQKGQLKGKLAYMSPEQARGKQVDRRSDLFAAGIVLWELLTGARLFDGENEAALLIALLSEHPAAPSTKDPSLSSLDSLVLKALEVDPSVRYQTALEMAAAVTATIPPATREEVAAWVKTEAKSSLRKREETIRHARSRVPVLRGWTEAVEESASGDPPSEQGEQSAAPPAKHETAAKNDPKEKSDPPKTSSSSMGLRRPGELGTKPPEGAKPVSLRPPPTDAPRLPRPPRPPLEKPGPKLPLDVHRKKTVPELAASPPSPSTSSAASGQARDSELETETEPGAEELRVEEPRAAEPRAAEPRAAEPRPAEPARRAEEVQAPAFWDTSTTSEDDEAATLAIPAEDAMRAWANAGATPGGALGGKSPVTNGTVPIQRPVLSVRDATLPLYMAPAHLRQEVARSQDAPPPSGERAEGIPSQVTSVTLTTTDLPPPIPTEQVKRLTRVAAISGAVGVVIAVASIIILSRRPWSADSTDSKRTTETAASATTDHATSGEGPTSRGDRRPPDPVGRDAAAVEAIATSALASSSSSVNAEPEPTASVTASASASSHISSSSAKPSGTNGSPGPRTYGSSRLPTYPSPYPTNNKPRTPTTPTATGKSRR